MADILLGAPVYEKIMDDVKARCRKLKVSGTHPKMAIIRLGDREDDKSYERNIERVCNNADIITEKHLLKRDITQDELIKLIHKLNDDNTVHGIMLFRPLPKHMNEPFVSQQLLPTKDIDGITDSSIASVFLGRGEGFAPCTAQACIRLLDHYNIPIAGKRAVIIGRSLVVGRPLSMMLLCRDATVTICHTKTKNMAELCRNADILIAAAGKARLVNEEFLSDRQVIIDVGFNVDDDGNVSGDVAFDEAEPFVTAISPVPAGVGGITARLLALHVIEAATISHKTR
ncbi:MAG: bifunctional 5,10-methylenetetrahydrofolate dehydrogenase/5,10-methenyltetrahydrofolate cyclohydrolase [Clostridiales bacterium]|jgi:methylenetetrahydrofolate dehydrogenase (NADP+)/methenyltetrahydrofolate cyclohydrolase|nr:bifunctional 5,10-methylenetetrahydrofolate dehydrogenase/5,10-methenyltetrahydrofolate cyclohydrolase [Clostridiales bacterium]